MPPKAGRGRPRHRQHLGIVDAAYPFDAEARFVLAVEILREKRNSRRHGKGVSLNEIWRDLADGRLPRGKLPAPWCRIATRDALKKAWERIDQSIRDKPGDYLRR